MRRVLYFVVIVALFAVSSCKKVDPPYIKVEMTEVKIPTAGENVSIPVSCNFDWKVKADQTWAKVKRNVEKETVDIYVSMNSLTDNRVAKVTLYSENADMPTATITVTQRQKNAIAAEGTNSYEVTSDEQTLQIRLRSNVDYSCVIPSDAASWLSVQPFTKGMQSVICNVAVKANESLSERRAELAIKADGCSDIQISVLQQGRPQILMLTYGNTGRFNVPALTTEDAEVKVMWAGQTRTYYSGMAMEIASAPTDVQIQGHKITVVELRDIQGLDTVDFTKL